MLTDEEMGDLLAAVGEVVSEQMSSLRGEMQGALNQWMTETTTILTTMKGAIEVLNESDHKLSARIDDQDTRMASAEGREMIGEFDARAVMSVLAKGMGLSVIRAKTPPINDPTNDG